MKGANLGNSPVAGSSQPTEPAWLSIKDIVEGVRALGTEVSERQLERWRDRKLLPPGIQEFEAPGSGGAYKFPATTIGLAVAIHQLQLEKNDLVWVGLQLWWRGYNVDESCWRPALIETAKRYDRTLRFIRTQMRTERDDNDDTSRNDTLADRVAPKLSSRNIAASILASRIIGRVSLGELPSVLRLILEAASGIEPEFEPGSAPEDERSLIRAMDLSTIKKDASSDEATFHDDKLAGRSLGLRRAVRPVLADIAAAIRHGTLRDAANASPIELEHARDDLKHTMALVPAFYGATKWIYGEKAFGLRFASWMCRKMPENILRLELLLWVLMRRAGADILNSAEIAQLHQITISLARSFLYLKQMSQQDGEFSKLLKPAHLKRVLSDEAIFESFIEKLKSSNLALLPENIPTSADLDVPC